MENESGSKVGPSGEALSSLADVSRVEITGDLAVRVLIPTSGVDGMIAFNGGSLIQTKYPNLTEINPPVTIYQLSDGATPMMTQAVGGPELLVYLYYEDVGSTRTYYESSSSSGYPRKAIQTLIEGNEYLSFELVPAGTRSAPTIVIGTIIIDIPQG